MQASTPVQPRRSSTRSIKRKKFDDELVESSLVKSDRGRLKALPVAEKSDATSSQDSVAAQVPEKKKVTVPPPEKKKVSFFVFFLLFQCGSKIIKGSLKQ